jgi:hypothetical protein
LNFKSSVLGAGLGLSKIFCDLSIHFRFASASLPSLHPVHTQQNSSFVFQFTISPYLPSLRDPVLLAKYTMAYSQIFSRKFQLLTLSSSLFLLGSFVPAFLEQWLNSVSSASILYSNSKGPQQCCQSRQQFSLHWNCEIVSCLVSPGPLGILRQSPSAVVNGCFGSLDHDLLKLSTQFTIAAVNGRHLPCSEFRESIFGFFRGLFSGFGWCACLGASTRRFSFSGDHPSPLEPLTRTPGRLSCSGVDRGKYVLNARISSGSPRQRF